MNRFWGFILWLIFTAVITANTYLFIIYIPRFGLPYWASLGSGLSLVAIWFGLEITLAGYLLKGQQGAIEV
jgi:hypothetical protein